MKRPRVLVADDHAIVITGLRYILEPEMEIVGVVADGRALVFAAKALKPDLVIIDISMPLLNGLEAARQIRKSSRKVKLLFLSMFDDVVYATEALRAGGSSYVLKTSGANEILTAVHKTLNGGTFVTPSIDVAILRERWARSKGADGVPTLTRRQREVLQLLAQGRSTKEIAQLLNVSPRTVEFHRYRIMEALALRTTAQLVPYAIRRGIVTI